ncbi:MAG: hypothetical protein ABEJ43_10015 [Haloferacaceae archaeon]
MLPGLAYRGSVAVCGGVLGVVGLSMLRSGHVTLTAVLLSIGGLGMVGAMGYEVTLSAGSSTTFPDDRIVLVAAAMGLLTIVAGVVSVAG